MKKFFHKFDLFYPSAFLTKAITAVSLCFSLLFSGCNFSTAAPPSPIPSAGSANPSSAAASAPVPSVPPIPTAQEYVAKLAREQAAKLTSGAKTPEEKIRNLYLWLVETVYFAEPVGLDVWRYRCQPDKPPEYLFQRALSPFCFAIGSCEDFAAAMTLLLRESGFEAEYVSGLTVSVGRDLVDHAWAMVRLDGCWYHLDPQLEQNIIRDGRIVWHYYLREDAFMLADHRWGENLAAYWSGQIGPEEKALLIDAMTPPAAPDAWGGVRPEPMELFLPSRPDGVALSQSLQAEAEAYAAHNPPLPPVSLNLTPPLFSVMPNPPESPIAPGR